MHTAVLIFSDLSKKKWLDLSRAPPDLDLSSFHTHTRDCSICCLSLSRPRLLSFAGHELQYLLFATRLTKRIASRKLVHVPTNLPTAVSEASVRRHVFFLI